MLPPHNEGGKRCMNEKDIKIIFDAMDKQILERIENLIKQGASKDYVDGFRDAFMCIGFLRDEHFKKYEKV